jgi:hypothetical protein
MVRSKLLRVGQIKMTPVHTVAYLSKIYCNMILTSTPRSPNGLFPSGFPNRFVHAFLVSRVRATYAAHAPGTAFQTGLRPLPSRTFKDTESFSSEMFGAGSFPLTFQCFWWLRSNNHWHQMKLRTNSCSYRRLIYCSSVRSNFIWAMSPLLLWNMKHNMEAMRIGTRWNWIA